MCLEIFDRTEQIGERPDTTRIGSGSRGGGRVGRRIRRVRRGLKGRKSERRRRELTESGERLSGGEGARD